MPQGPAARLGDPTQHGTPLAPGPGSPNVMIGFKPAWRGIPLAAGAGLMSGKASEDIALSALATTTAAATGPALPIAQTAEMTGRTAAETAMASAISSIASAVIGPADQHMCAMPFAAAPPDYPASPAPPGPPHGPGVVIDGSATVMINMLPACRQGDHVLEAIGPLDPIAMGCPTVIIGG